MSPDPAADPRCRKPAVVKKVEDEARTRGLEVTFYISASVDTMLELLWEPDNFRMLYPAVKRATVRSRTNDVVEVDVSVDAVIKEVRYVIRRELDRAARSITWREVEGDLRRTRGGWWIEETERPGVSKCIYRDFVDVAYWIPSGAVAAVAKRKVNDMVTRLREVAAEITAA